MLAILSTHPIQYQVPIWQSLAKDGQIPFEVWYLTDHGVRVSHDKEFRKDFAWDIEMLSGYPHRFLHVAAGATPTSFTRCRLREKLRDRLQSSHVRSMWVQGWQVSAYWQAVWEAKQTGVEVWLRGESNDLAPATWWKRPLKRLLLGKLLGNVDRFLYIGTANKRFFQSFGVPDDRLFSAPYAIDNERFGKQAAEFWGRRAEIRQNLRIPRDAFCVLFCGKFIPKKCPSDLITAAARLMAESNESKIHLLFVGSGELGDELRRRCNVVFDAEAPRPALARRPLSSGDSARPSASFAGFLNQTEISQAYVAADCLVLPSDHGETWGLVVNEAMSSGLPCLISDRCGCAEDLGRFPPNNVFPFGDTQAIARQILQMPSLRLQGRLSNAFVAQYSFSQTVSLVKSLYNSCSS